MATDTAPEFGRVSRARGKVFEAVAFGSSVVGIVALAMLLAYVVVDAFGLDAADDGWLLTYVATVVVPTLALWTYRLDRPRVTRGAAAALALGVPAAFLVDLALGAVGVSIPALEGAVLYCFAVVLPVTAVVVTIGRDGPVGAAASGLLGRIVAGLLLGVAALVVFEVIAPQLWFLIYTLAVVPPVAIRLYARRTGAGRLARLALPISFVGFVAAVAVHRLFVFYAPYWTFHVWSLAIPVAVAVGLLDEWGSRRNSAITGGVTLAALVIGSLAIGTQGIAAGYGLFVLLGLVPAGLYVVRTLDVHPARVGLLVPVVIAVGALLGTLIVSALGFAGPEPWLDWGFLTSPTSRNAPEAGYYPAIVGSILIISLVAVLSFAFGVGTAVFLEEYTPDEGPIGTITRIVQINIANLAAVPSVVYGLLGLGLFANFLSLGLGTVVTAGLTLSLLILPITIISAQEALRAVPDELRQGSDAMGATRWQTTKNVVIPEALPGIFTGTILALGRAIGETAPLLLVGAVASSTAAPSTLFDKVSAMPLQLFNWYSLPEPFPRGVVAAGVVTLLTVLLVMNGTAIVLRNKYERSEG